LLGYDGVDSAQEFEPFKSTTRRSGIGHANAYDFENRDGQPENETQELALAVYLTFWIRSREWRIKLRTFCRSALALRV
jgi:hypothetical protein